MSLSSTTPSALPTSPYPPAALLHLTGAIVTGARQSVARTIVLSGKSQNRAGAPIGGARPHLPWQGLIMLRPLEQWIASCREGTSCDSQKLDLDLGHLTQIALVPLTTDRSSMFAQVLDWIEDSDAFTDTTAFEELDEQVPSEASSIQNAWPLASSRNGIDGSDYP